MFYHDAFAFGGLDPQPVYMLENDDIALSNTSDCMFSFTEDESSFAPCEINLLRDVTWHMLTGERLTFTLQDEF